MEVPESSQRTGDSVRSSYFIHPPVYKFTEVPDRYVAPQSKLSQRLIQLKRESSERVGPVALESYVNFPPLCSFTELHDSEEMRMMNQARLGNELRSDLSKRFHRPADSSYEKKKSAKSDRVTSLFGGPRPPVELQRHEEHRVIKLTNVCLHHSTEAQLGTLEVHTEAQLGTLEVHKEAQLGTLEVHTNGFIYTASGLRIVFMNANVQGCFVRLGDHGHSPNLPLHPPLLLFRLKRPIVIKAKKTLDIQFWLRPPNPGITEKKLNEDLKNFVQKFNESHRVGGWSDVPIIPLEFEALEECEFVGILGIYKGGQLATFALTYSALVVLVEGGPYTVIPLLDVVIVNLSFAGASRIGGRIEVTFIYEQDFKAGVFQFQLISSKYLTSIKHRLNHAQVKYYVNKEGLYWDWDLIVRKMAESLEMFDQQTLLLEDSRTLSYYPDANPGSDSELLEKYGSVQL